MLFARLERHGWDWREEFIYAPNATMWLLGSEPWIGDVDDFYERMLGRLARNQAAHWMYKNVEEHRALVSDTRSLVEALASVMSARDAEPFGQRDMP